MVFGKLQKNTYKDKNSTQIVIKSDKYLAFL